MEWSRAMLISCLAVLIAFAAFEIAFIRQSELSNLQYEFSTSIGVKPERSVAAQERLSNRERRYLYESRAYPYYTISPRYYYQNSPYHQSRYSYYNGFRYFFPNYDPPTYYYGAPYTVGVSVQFDQPPPGSTPAEGYTPPPP